MRKGTRDRNVGGGGRIGFPANLSIGLTKYSNDSRYFLLYGEIDIREKELDCYRFEINTRFLVKWIKSVKFFLYRSSSKG